MARSSKNQPANIQRLVHLNDDDAEKRRRRSSIRQAADTRRASMAAVARDTFRRGGTHLESSGVPLMANFEEWMKLVKDNKINQTNSWNFALIDYFHDMAVLKEGDGGINFQKASYTLDGCVKIYTSRVDSVASETGKLLSGLADGGKELKRNNGDGDEDAEGEENASDNEEAKKRQRSRRKNRSEATLASSFAQIQVKNLDLELSVDPLFRKMCADFNEGGAKGLLLNSLAIDSSGRVVFDGQVDQQPEETPDKQESDEEPQRQIVPVNLSTIKDSFFSELSNVDNFSVCPSLPKLQNALKDPSMSTAASDFIKDIETHRLEDEGAFAGDIGDFDDDNGGAFELDPIMGEQEESLLEFGVPDIGGGDSSAVGSGSHVQAPGGVGNGVTVVMNGSATQEGHIMAYFDETLRKNWAGPEHWKIQRIKGLQNLGGTSGDTTDAQLPKKRTERVAKEPFFIDFLGSDGEVDEAVLFAEGGSNINLPKTQHKSKTRNLLPNDEHFSSQSLIKLFLKPKAQMFHKVHGGIGGSKGDGEENVDIDVDENFFAENYQGTNGADTGNQGDYEANFFQTGDDGADDAGFDNDYEDAPGGQLPFGASQAPVDGSGNNGLLLGNRRARPEYVNYAKTAKKVNIKLLKDNIWNTLDIPTSTPSHVPPSEEQEGGKNSELTLEQEQQVSPHAAEERKFTDMVQDLKGVYAPQQMTDISTSFCFICLLHLANEKGLVIEDNEDNTELTIRKDLTVSQAELSA